MNSRKRFKDSTFDPRKHPILAARLADGSIWVHPAEYDGGAGTYEGRAADGTVVYIGMVYDADGAERYLASGHTTPDTW